MSIKPHHNTIAGIDGCSYGWLMVTFDGNQYDYNLYKDFLTLVEGNYTFDRILIDIPIGLSSAGFIRNVDSLLKKELKHRHATVFNAPCRKAIYEKDKEIAKEINIQIEGKSLSYQSLNIRSKIGEVDQYLTQNYPSFNIIESHPELCFKYLSGSILSSKKSTPKGQEERLDILSSYDKSILDLYHQIEENELRKNVKRDDIIDAICLSLVNKLGTEQEFSFIQDENMKIDEEGIRLKVAYFNCLKL